ncbi:MAG: DUF2085 domain-containing protein [Candidatus Helarchaeota archaeon]
MKWKEIVHWLLAHHSRDNLSHTIKISIGKRELYLCARCTSLYSALIISYFLFGFVIDIRQLPLWIIHGLAYCFGTPIILSWGWQTIMGQDNSNKTRILTGVGGGIGLAILLYLPSPFRELNIFGIFGIVFFILYFGKIRRYKKNFTIIDQDE